MPENRRITSRVINSGTTCFTCNYCAGHHSGNVISYSTGIGSKYSPSHSQHVDILGS